MNSTPFFIENEKEVNKQVCRWMSGAVIVIWIMLLTYVCFMAAYVFRSIEISKPIRADEMLREISKFL